VPIENINTIYETEEGPDKGRIKDIAAQELTTLEDKYGRDLALKREKGLEMEAKTGLTEAQRTNYRIMETLQKKYPDVLPSYSSEGNPFFFLPMRILDDWSTSSMVFFLHKDFLGVVDYNYLRLQKGAGFVKKGEFDAEYFVRVFNGRGRNKAEERYGDLADMGSSLWFDLGEHQEHIKALFQKYENAALNEKKKMDERAQKNDLEKFLEGL
jgi:hypothetical protein